MAAYYFRQQKEATGKNGVAASCDDRATEVGLEVLKQGGNAIDAAVTIAFLMAVYEPYNSGLGGHGGHMALYWGRTGEYLAIDASTRAPAQARPDMFEIVSKPPEHPGDVWRVRVKDDANRLGFRAMFAPSTVAGYWYLVNNYGTLPWKDLIAPAIKAAEEGFVADELYVNAIKKSAGSLKQFPGSMEMYLPGGRLPEAGDRIIYPDLARTLKKLAAEGADIFYHGEIADHIVNYVQKNGGILTPEDFYAYRVEVSPLTASSYRGHTILTYPQASNGAILAEVLNILAPFDLRKMGYNSIEGLHVFIEALKLAFIDRYEYAGDRDFSPVPYEGLMAWGYGRERAKEIQMDRAQVFKAGNPWKYQGSGCPIDEARPQAGSGIDGAKIPFRGDGKEDTTFLCASDRQGNILLLTTSNQAAFGCKVTVPGTGITLNSSMSSANPVPGHPLSIGPFKRILRNSGPCFVVKDERPYLILSAPGGRQIISAILRTLTNMIDYGMSLQAAIDAPRIHSEGNLFKVSMEERIPEGVRRRLKEMGHEIALKPAYDSDFAYVQAIRFDMKLGLMVGGSEPRTHGGAMSF